MRASPVSTAVPDVRQLSLTHPSRIQTTPGGTLADGYGSYGEPVRCVRSKSDKITEFWSPATRFLPADKVAREMKARYGSPKSARKR